MMSRYREVADIVLKYLEHRDRLVRLSITSLLPRIAHFLRDRFVTNYLKVLISPFSLVLRIGVAGLAFSCMINLLFDIY